MNFKISEKASSLKDFNEISLDEMQDLTKDLYTWFNRASGHKELASLLMKEMKNIPVGTIRKWFNRFNNGEKLPTGRDFQRCINDYVTDQNSCFSELEKKDKWHPDQSTSEAIERCINVAKRFYVSDPERYLKAKENLLKECPYLAMDFQEENRDLKKIGAEHKADALFENKKNRGLFMLGEYIEINLRKV